MDSLAYFDIELAEHRAVAEKTGTALRDGFGRLVDEAVASVAAGGKILFFGNGGSAADAQHLATELTVRYAKNRAPIAAIALTTDTSALTAIGNDFDFTRIFARQIEAIGRKGDLVIAISTSGQSENVIQALQTAKKMGLRTAALGGRDGGRMNGLADPLLIVPSETTPRIQEMHIMIGQMLCGAVEIALGLVPAPGTKE